MKNNTYSLAAFDQLLTHCRQQPLTLHDGMLHPKDELAAQVASNDYFAMLATCLDQISQNLADSQHADHITLESLVDDLLYLQQHYRIVKRQT